MDILVVEGTESLDIDVKPLLDQLIRGIRHMWYSDRGPYNKMDRDVFSGYEWHPMIHIDPHYLLHQGLSLENTAFD